MNKTFRFKTKEEMINEGTICKCSVTGYYYSSANKGFWDAMITAPKIKIND